MMELIRLQPCLLLVLLALLVAPCNGFYERGSDVISMDSPEYASKIAKSDFLWIIGRMERSNDA